MGRYFIEYVDDTKQSKFKYTCKCGCDVAPDQALLWEGFMQFDTPAFLFKSSVNVEPFTPVREETLSTGRYQLVDVRCRICTAPLGWKYLKSDKSDQKYKESCLLLQQSALERVEREDEMRYEEESLALWA